MKVHTNIATDTELAELRQSFDSIHQQGLFSTKYYIDHKDTIKEVFNSDEDIIVQQERLDVRRHDIIKLIFNIFKRVAVIDFHKNNIFFVRCHHPIGIHSDADIPEHQGRTFILPLTFDNRIKTFAWKERMTNPEFNVVMDNFRNNPSQFTQRSNLSKEFKLNNAWSGTPSLVDYLELDNIGSWDKGSIIEFDRTQLHSSTNFKDLVGYKDSITIHTNE